VPPAARSVAQVIQFIGEFFVLGLAVPAPPALQAARLPLRGKRAARLNQPTFTMGDKTCNY
jgi:hypothetical protein